jgi:hypothetical protein
LVAVGDGVFGVHVVTSERAAASCSGDCAPRSRERCSTLAEDATYEL